METLQWLGAAVQQQIASAFWSVTGNVLFYAVLGLFVGIAIVVIAGRKKIFRRTHSVWSFLAGLNYVYIPVLLMLFGGVMGGIRGMHKSATRFVDETSAPLISYGQKYVGHLQTYLQTIPWEQHPDMTLDEAIAREVTSRSGIRLGSIAHDMLILINRAVVNHVLDEMDIPPAVRNPVGVARALKDVTLTAGMFSTFPRTLRAYCNQWFWLKYALFGAVFLPFLLLPVGEYVAYRVYQRMNRPSQGQRNEIGNKSP